MRGGERGENRRRGSEGEGREERTGEGVVRGRGERREQERG